MTKKTVKKIIEDANKMEFILLDGTKIHVPVSVLVTDAMEDLYSEIIGMIIRSELSLEQSCRLAHMIGDCGPGDIEREKGNEKDGGGA